MPFIFFRILFFPLQKLLIFEIFQTKFEKKTSRFISKNKNNILKLKIFLQNFQKRRQISKKHPKQNKPLNLTIFTCFSAAFRALDY